MFATNHSTVFLFLLCFIIPSVSNGKNYQLLMYKAQCKDAENYVACARAGVLLEKLKKKRQAYSFYLKACMAKKPVGMACFLAGLLEKNSQQAFRLYKRGCENKDPDACTQVGALTHKTAPKKALTFFRKGCSQGDGRGCYFLGLAYAKNRQPEKAKKLYTYACKFRYGKGCFALSRLLDGKPKRVSERSKWLTQGCRNRHLDSCFSLAGLYQQQKQAKKATALYLYLCKKGLKKACKK